MNFFCIFFLRFDCRESDCNRCITVEIHVILYPAAEWVIVQIIYLRSTTAVMKARSPLQWAYNKLKVNQFGTDEIHVCPIMSPSWKKSYRYRIIDRFCLYDDQRNIVYFLRRVSMLCLFSTQDVASTREPCPVFEASHVTHQDPVRFPILWDCVMIIPTVMENKMAQCVNLTERFVANTSVVMR